MKRIVSIILIISFAFILCGCDSSDYKKAWKYVQDGKFDKAIELYESLGDYEDSEWKLNQTKYLKLSRYFLTISDEDNYDQDLDKFYIEYDANNWGNIYDESTDYTRIYDSGIDDLGNPVFSIVKYSRLKYFYNNGGGYHVTTQRAILTLSSGTDNCLYTVDYSTDSYANSRHSTREYPSLEGKISKSDITSNTSLDATVDGIPEDVLDKEYDLFNEMLSQAAKLLESLPIDYSIQDLGLVNY